MKKHYPLSSTKCHRKSGLIFISHSSKDIRIISNFVDRILILGLDISRNRIFFTSEGDTGVNAGKDSKKTIIKKMKSSKAVIEIVTQNYKCSAVCLNEMGAAAVLPKKVIVLSNSQLKPQEIGFINTTTQVLKIDSEDDLFKFLHDHKDLNGGLKVNPYNYYRQVKGFLEIIRKPSLVYLYTRSILRWNQGLLLAG